MSPSAPTQTADTWLHRVAVHVLARWDGRLMLLLPVGDEQWTLPTAELGATEPASWAACRILAEQVGLDVDPARMWPICTQHNWTAQGSRIDLYFTPSTFRGFPAIMDRTRYEDLRWFDEPQPPPDTAPHVRAAVYALRKPETYGEIGWPRHDGQPG